MYEEQENEISTRTKINTLINDIQNKINKRSLYNFNNQNNGNIDLNLFQSFGGTRVSEEQNNYKKIPTFNNYFKKINNNIPLSPQPTYDNSENYSLNEYYLRNLIKEEFSNLILPYQKDIMCNSNLMESKLNDIEKKFQIIINAQNMGNLNDNAKIISAYLSSNLSSDNANKSIEILKIEYNTLFDELKKTIDSLNKQLNTEKIQNDSNILNLSKKIETFERRLNQEQNKEIKIYVEKDIFDEVIDNFNERQNKIINDNENNIRNINQQTDNFNRLINQIKNDINNNTNKINGLSNNLNSLRSDSGKLTEDISQIKYQVTPEIINKINSIDFNSLKQQIPLNDFKNLKNNVDIIETNINSIKTMSENSDRNIYDLKKLITSVEQKQNLSNKNIENIQPLLNGNVLDKINEINNKIIDINNKIEEIPKIKNSINNIKQENKENKNNDNNNNEEKKEEEGELFIGGSRRQQRNNKNTNNNNKNINLDEKSLNLIKQLEKINLNELEKLDVKNILSQLNNLTNENKTLSDKINEQNKIILEINEKIKNLKTNNTNNILLPEQNPLNNNPFSYRKQEKIEDFKERNNFEINDPYSRVNKINDINNENKNIYNRNEDILNNDKKEDEIIEDDYDDFDKDFEDNKNEFNINKTKENDKENNIINNIDDKNQKSDFLDNNKFKADELNKKGGKNEFGSFDKYAETNILDQIMGLGASRRNNDFDNNFNGGGTFITGSLTGSKNNNIDYNNFNNKPSIFDDEIKNKSKISEEIKDKKDIKIEEKKEEKKKKKDDEFDDDDFDDFDIEDI